MGVIRDTQIASRYIKEMSRPPAGEIMISSVTAGELLEVHSKGRDLPNFYPRFVLHRMHVPLLGGIAANSNMSKRAMPGGRIILSFGGKYPDHVEHGSLAMSRLINGRDLYGFKLCISHMSKNERSRRLKIFASMLDLGVRCVPLRRKTADVAMNIFSKFRYQPKENIRNTINDMLVLATASRAGICLHTEDDLLRRFSVEILGASILGDNEHLVDFSSSPGTRSKSLESKGYINRGWAVLERRGN
jgi:predicted nucleic acid-binding protein